MNNISQLGAILSLWAHPDDETFCCAGIMALAAQNGQKVLCVTATKGEAGVQDSEKWPPETLGQVREAELMEALQLIGVSGHQWLGYPDGGCERIDTDEAIEKILQRIDDFLPDTILTFGPEGMTGHPDHQAVSRWAIRLAERFDKKPVVYQAIQLRDKYEQYMKEADEKLDIYFNIDKPPLRDSDECDIYVDLPEDIQRLKCQALRVMPSQTEILLQNFDEQFLCKALGAEGFIRTSITSRGH